MQPFAGHETDEDREIVTTRTIAAPPRLVFEAWTDPAHFTRWWGPHGFTTTTHTFEFRPGGEWEFTMHGPDGTDYANHVRWRVIDAPSRLEYVHGSVDEDPAAFESTVTFEARDGATEVVLRVRFATRAQRDAAVERVGAAEGGRQTLERLASFIAERVPA